jgi:ankyrin repeat protein
MNVNVRTSSGTALHEAAMCGKTEVVRTLLKNGIDLNIRDAQNNTVSDVLKQFPCHVVHDIYSLIKSKFLEHYSDGRTLTVFVFGILFCRVSSNV